MEQLLQKTVWQVLKKLNIELPYDPAIPFLEIYPKDLKASSQRDICAPVFIAALFTIAKKWKQTDKQNVVYSYNGILFSLKKERYSDTCYNMDEACKHYAKRSQPETEGQMLHASTYMRYLESSTSQKQKGEWWLPGAGRKGEWESFLFVCF